MTKNDLIQLSPDFPFDARSAILSFNVVERIDAIAFSPEGEWAVVAGGLVAVSSGVPDRDQLVATIHAARAIGGRIDELALIDDGWLVTASSFSFPYNLPSDLVAALTDLHDSDRSLEHVSIGSDGRWVLVADQWFASSGVSARLHDRLQLWLRDGRRISHLMLGEANDYLMYSHGAFDPDRKIERLENNLAGDNIFQRMEDAQVAGIGLAVIKDKQVHLARGYGTLEAGTQRWVRADSPFDLASLSKFLGALTTMTLVDDGYLPPTAPVELVAQAYGESNVVADWIAAQDGGTVPPGIQLHRLLSHSAGIVPHSSTGIAPANWPNTPPITWDLLQGFDGAGYNPSREVRYDPALGPPGSQYDYSGGGFLLAEAIAETVTGDAFADLMQERVFDALEMRDTTAHQPLSETWSARAAVMHNADGEPRARTVYPWRSAGGVYASAADYARAMIVLIRRGKSESGARFLDAGLADFMLTDHAPGSTRYGLGVGLSSDGAFSHSGSHGGRARTKMWADPDRNKGIVVLINGGDSGGSAIADLVNDIVARFRELYL